jgi:Dolichyl-phosphate-mannose-protein mannosyltransferase
VGQPRSGGRLLVAILCLAAGLRGYAVWFGLPHAQARPDETVAFGIAAAIAAGDPNPHFFHWPTLHLYVLAGLFWCLRAVRTLTGAAGDPTFTEYALVGRVFVACAGTATVYVTYRLARRLADTPAALMAALFLAVAVLHVRDSHFALADILMTLLATLSLGLVLRFVDDALASDPAAPWRLGSVAAAGLAAGLATSAKYNGGAVAAAMLAAQAVAIVRTGRSPWQVESWVPLCVYLVFLGVGFIAGTPYALLDPVAFARGFMFNFSHLTTGHGVEVGPAWMRHLTFSLPAGLGPLVCLAAIWGGVLLGRRRADAAVILGAVAACLFLAIGRGRTAFARYILLLLPIACALAGVGVAAIGRGVGAWLRRPHGPTLAAVSLLVAAPSLANSVWLDVLLGRTDTRVLAARWLAGRLPARATLYESGSPYVRLDLRRLRIHRWELDSASGRFQGTEAVPDWLILHRSPVSLYTVVPPSVAVLAQRQYRLIRRFDATVPGSRPGAYDHQDAFFLPLAGFRGILRPGPTIEIYQRRAR